MNENSEKKWVPQSKNPPAKLKDAGASRFAMKGCAVYNAKSDAILLLPQGVALRDLLVQSLAGALERRAIQPVDCDGDAGALFSLAERFVRDYPDCCRAYAEDRGRTFFLKGWERTDEESAARIASVYEAFLEALRDHDHASNFSLIREIAPEGLRHVIACPGQAGDRGAREGVACPACGFSGLPHAPFSSPRNESEPQEACAPMEEVLTPGAKTIDLLCEMLGVTPARTIKTMFYVAEGAESSDRLVAVLIRGDRNVSGVKVARALGADRVRVADAQRMSAELGEVAGYCGPVGLPVSVCLIADESVRDCRDVVIGANKQDAHYRGACWGRDFETPAVHDLCLLEPSTPCPECGHALAQKTYRAVGEFGHASEADAGPKLVSRSQSGAVEYPAVWQGSIDLLNILFALEALSEPIS